MLFLLVFFQGGYYFLDFYLPVQGRQLEVNTVVQNKIDSLKEVQIKDESFSYSVNPNYLSDFRGYLLGMSPQEIDRLHNFRAKRLYVQSLDEFQRITAISDSLLEKVAPNFRFPKARKSTSGFRQAKKPSIEKKDINTASAAELESIYGIGEVLSKRIIKFRNALGGFLSMEQIYDVYGLDEEVVNSVQKKYQIVEMPEIIRVSINDSTVPELASIVYLSWDVAREIVTYRNTKGSFSEWDELTAIPGFPFEKIERIKLYLTL